jgi:putative oxidoreductase
MQATKLRSTIEANRDLLLDLVRIYLGVGLMAKGADFWRNMASFIELMPYKHAAAAPVLIAHYVILAHVIGGFLLALGLMTRVAAAVQLPVLLGAIAYVHWDEGLFQPAQNLELVILVFFLLAVITVGGAGRLSLDEWLVRRGSDVSPPTARRASTA